MHERTCFIILDRSRTSGFAGRIQGAVAIAPGLATSRGVGFWRSVPGNRHRSLTTRAVFRQPVGDFPALHRDGPVGRRMTRAHCR